MYQYFYSFWQQETYFAQPRQCFPLLSDLCMIYDEMWNAHFPLVFCFVWINDPLKIFIPITSSHWQKPHQKCSLYCGYSFSKNKIKIHLICLFQKSRGDMVKSYINHKSTTPESIWKYAISTKKQTTSRRAFSFFLLIIIWL